MPLVVLWQATRPAPPVPLLRPNVDLGPEAALPSNLGASAILSPDGARLVFIGRSAAGKSRLYTRLLDQSQAALLSGTESARDPFFSPDGQWVGFFAGGKRFAVLMSPEAEGEEKTPTHVTFLLNFFDDLRRRVPRK